MSASDIASTISALLQAQWSLSSPTVAQILWTMTRVDSALFLSGSQAYAIGTYNPSSPTTVDVLSRECWQETERVYIDIIIKVVASTPLAATETRETMKNEVYRIMHLNQLTISGVSEAYIERELNKVEGTDLVRITLQAACLNFHVQT